jgi:hypothetical protein
MTFGIEEIRHFEPDMRVNSTDAVRSAASVVGWLLASVAKRVALTIADVCSLSTDQLMVPECHAFRLALQTLDRVDTSEIRPWECFLCHTGSSPICCACRWWR